MAICELKWPKVNHKYAPVPGEQENFLFRPRPLPSEFANTCLKLVPGGYDNPGKLTLKPYQTGPVDAITEWYGNRRIMFKGPTRTFKSGMAEVVMYWGMKYLSINGMIAYAEHDTVSLIFRTRISPMIRQNKEMRVLWNGVEDNLTTKNIVLRNCLWRAASAQDINDIASMGAGFVIGSEVSKWQRLKDNPILKMYGRQSAYPAELRASILESTPFEVGDYFYEEIYRDGTLVLQPHYPCPVCGEFQVFQDKNIRLREDEVEEHSRQAARLRDEKEKAVKYLCPNCNQEITEHDRVTMDSKVVWAAPGEVDITFHPDIHDEESRRKFIAERRIWEQPGEAIDKCGNISGLPRTRYDRVCFDWNRSVDVNFTFYEWLAQFFDSCKKADKYHTYENETNCHFWNPAPTHKQSISALENKKGDYYMFAGNGHGNFIPDDVLRVTAGIDTQNDEFYYCIIGWGPYMKMYVLRHGRIYCPVDKPEYTDRLVLLNIFRDGLLNKNVLQKKDGTIMPILTGFVDRGGEKRHADIDLIDENISNIWAYTGAANSDLKMFNDEGLVVKSKTCPGFYCAAMKVSELMGEIMESDKFILPLDCGRDFMAQALNHVHDVEIDSKGNPKKVMRKIDPDHYRSCLNMALAAAILEKLDKSLNDSADITSFQKPVINIPQAQPNRNPNINQGYFQHALGGGRRF